MKGSPKISHLDHRKEKGVDDYHVSLCGGRSNDEMRKGSQDGEFLMENRCSSKMQNIGKR